MGDEGISPNVMALEPDHFWTCDNPTCSEYIDWPETSGVPQDWFILSVMRCDYHTNYPVSKGYYYHSYGCMIHDTLRAVGKSRPS